jgi:hypothetical protein
LRLEADPNDAGPIEAQLRHPLAQLTLDPGTHLVEEAVQLPIADTPGHDGLDGRAYGHSKSAGSSRFPHADVDRAEPPWRSFHLSTLAGVTDGGFP